MEKVKVRINNSHKHIWAVVWNGQPEDFSDAKDITLIASVRDKRINLTQGIDYVIEGNLVKIDFTPRFCKNTGVYNIELNYTKPSESFLSGERRTAVDLNVIEIVGTSACADATDETSSVSEAAFGFQGLSAYEVWLKDNPGKTKEDYFNWLQKPATDIAETVNLQEQARVEAEELRVLAEQDRHANTQEAISNAENATENANTAAQNANDAADSALTATQEATTAASLADTARLAIQTDLAQKADHGYEINPKTLKEVDDEIVQLKSELDRLKSISITSEDLVLKGRYITLEGSVGSSSVSNTSNLIPCKDAHYVSLMFQTLDATSIYFGFAFYDESKQLIERISAELDPSGVRGGRERILKIPSNAHYLRCQYWNEEKRIEYDAPEFYLTIDDTGLLFKQIAEISSGLKPIYTQEDLTIKNRYIRYRDDYILGNEYSSTASDSTGFLKCNNFSKLTLMQPVWTRGSTGLGFYNKDFELISYIRNRSGESNTSYEITIEVPENAYYFRTTYWNKETIEEFNLPEFYVVAGTLAENINELYSKVRTTSLDGSYTVSFTAEKIIVTNVATNGSITFDLIGSDTLSGNFTDNKVLKGGKLIRKVEDEFKVMNVTFDLTSDSAPLQIYTHTTYKVDTEIENDGIEGICSGDMGFLKDENVFVEGNPMIAGFTDNAKTKFALCADYGSMTPHYDKIEEVKYTDIDVVKGERKFAKLSVLKEESPLRLLNQPNGYNATFTFASHADRATVPITKAIFYGTDNEASPTYNTNGLLSYGIKGTMSVFAEGHTSSHAALDNASFKALIDDAYSKGIEIIPHTITYNPDTRADAERVLPFFKDNYNSRNWIDHFLRQDNPSIGLHSKGNDIESPHYIMDLMEQYGYDYSWCYIDTTPDGVVRNQLFEEHYQFRRDLLFKNKKLTFPDGTPMWQYKNTWKMFETIIGREEYDEIEHIQNLIDTCNVWADHCYLTAAYGQLWKQEGSETFIDPKFDSMLSFVKNKKETGEIWNPTQSEYNDYLAKLMNISIVRSGVGQYKVFSKNEENVNCSFLLKNTFKDVYLNGVLAESKVSGDNMIFWGDIKQGENTITVS